jgi:hypothetical protein
MELNMFRRVNGGSSAPCQERPDVFKKIRGSIYSSWSHEMLDSYYKDLIMAQRNNRNLVYEKYARMDNKIPPINDSPLIGKIVEIEQKWQEELKSLYPAIYHHTCRDINIARDGSNFKIYLASELETYGKKTLEKYFVHVKKAVDRGENLSIEMLRKLTENSGIESLEKLETLMQNEVNL